MQRNDRATAAMAELARRFPRLEFNRAVYGPEPIQLYQAAVKQLEKQGAGTLAVTADAKMAIFIDDHYAGMGSVTESVGGAMAMSSASGVAISIGGSNTEMVGAARLELVKGGKSEVTATAKVEAVGVYVVKAAQSYGVDAKAAITLAVAGAQTTKTGGGHSIAATGPVDIKTGAFSAKASGKITLACGACEVVISSSGIDIKGAGKLKIDGSTIQLNENPLGTYEAWSPYVLDPIVGGLLCDRLRRAEYCSAAAYARTSRHD